MSGGIGSGMSPRPWWVPATPSTRSLPEAVEGVAVDRGHGDHPHPAVAPDRDLDDVTRAPRPEPRVELLLRADGHAVHAQDPVALLEARARRGPDRREVADDEAVLHVHRVDAEPRPRRAARAPAPSSFTTPRPVSRSSPTTRAATLRPSRSRASMAMASRRR